MPGPGLIKYVPKTLIYRYPSVYSSAEVTEHFSHLSTWLIVRAGRDYSEASLATLHPGVLRKGLSLFLFFLLSLIYQRLITRKNGK